MTKEQTNSWEEEFVEKGADLEHTRWSKWQEYFFSKCKTGRIDEDDKEVVLVLPRGLYDRWWLQINTLYSELSEAEKESDRREVRQYLPLLKEIISQEKEKWVAEKVKQLTPPETWKQCLKIGTGQDEMCMMCGFNPKQLLDLLQNK